jgi:copper resistance protein B
VRRLIASFSAATAMLAANPVAAQSMAGMNVPGMAMPGATKAHPPKKKVLGKDAAHSSHDTAARPSPPPRQAAPAPTTMSGMDHSAGSGMDMSGGSPMHEDDVMPGMTMPGPQSTSSMPAAAMTGTALPAGDAPAPRPPTDHYADRQYPPDEMARARDAMMHESGRQTFYQLMFNLAEYQARRGGDGYRWDGEAWVGGDIDRLWLKSEGEGAFRKGVDSVEIQALYSHAIGPYFNIQAGLRHDIRPGPNRSYATIGFEGLAPYWFEVQAALFLSTKGDLLGRLEGYYDQHITQRLILQPRVELNLAAQDVPENRIGAGLSSAELGLRLRYELSRQFAPYVGVSYEAKAGRTARFARADGEDPTSTSLVAGVRLWF